MSVEDFKKYGQMIAERPEVRAKAKEIGIDNVDGQIRNAKTLGLEFTKQDLAQAIKTSGVSSQELSEEQLEKVAGGAISLTAVAGLVVSVVALGASVGTTATRDW